MDNGHEPATKADVKNPGEQVCAEIRRGFDDLKETIRGVRAEIVKAFNGFAQSADAKLNETELDDLVFRLRITDVELRLAEIEKRINMRPQ